MKRRGIAAAVFVVVLVGAAPTPGQPGEPEFWKTGLELIGRWLAEPRRAIHLRVQSTGRGRCTVGKELIVAEAERALRRDGLRVATESLLLGPVLHVTILGLPVEVRGRATGCTAAVVVEADSVDLTEDFERRIIRAFRTVSIMTAPFEAQAISVRQDVEESVSMLANRLRREIDAARREGR